MRFFNSITIKSRLISAYFILLLLFVIFAVFSVAKIRTVGNLARVMYDHSLQVSNAALRAKMGIVKMHRSIKDVALSQTQDKLVEAIEAINFEEQLVLEDLDIVRDKILGLEGMQMEAEARKSFLEWKEFRTRMVNLASSGDKKGAKAITIGRGADHVRLLERQMTDLATYSVNKAGGFLEEAESTQTGVVRQVVVFICTLILLLIITGYLLIKGILDNIASLNETMSGISQTGILAKSYMAGKHEIAEMAYHFNNMVETLSILSAVQREVRELDSVMVAHTTLDNFGAKFTQQLIESTGSLFGVFYLYHQRDKRFEYVFSMGVDQKRLKAFDDGDLYVIFEQAFTTRKVTFIHGIPEDTVFTVNTIVGGALPRSIVTIPILIREEVAAIIVLGSLFDYSKVALRILEQIQSKAGTALSNILFNQKTIFLAAELKSKNRELETQANELHAITEDLKRRNMELDIKREQLESANRMKSVFLSNMSHELRTPLNSVMALSNVLKMDAADKLTKEELEYLDVIERNGKRLLDLINNILDLSKIEAGHMDIVLSFFSIETTVENILDSLKPLALGKGLNLHLQIASELPKIHSDEKRVHQIILNLVGNAVKFTEKGEVVVSAESDGERILIKVTDTGIGIASEHLGFIFEEFKQVDGSPSRRHEGTGLGLAIAHKATLNLGGELLVESLLAKGSTFTLCLPVIWPGETKRTENIKCIESYQNKIEKKSVLVVDDDPETIDLIAGYLLQEGYNPLTALSGIQAIEMAVEYQPFAMTLDLVMPDMDGLEILQRLKQNPKTASIPVIIVSVSNDYKAGLALGAVGYVTKPVNRDELIREILRVCEKPALVMVADDDELDRRRIKKMVAQENISVVEAADGKICLDKIRTEMPDVLVLDLLMPQFDGFEVLKVLRNDPLTLDLPVIIVTAKDLTIKERELLNQFVVSVFYKSSITQKSLLDEIGKYLRNIEMTVPPKSSSVKPSAKKNSDRGATDNFYADPAMNIPPGNEVVQARRKILIIEDNRDNLLTLRAVLKKRYFLIEAEDGEKGIDAVRMFRPDLILLDISLPGMDGYAVVKELKSDDALRHIPVIAITAHAMKGDREKVISAGCNDYLSKPIKPDKIIETILKWL